MGVWGGRNGWGGGGGLDVFDKGSHFLVSHFWGGGGAGLDDKIHVLNLFFEIESSMRPQ